MRKLIAAGALALALAGCSEPADEGPKKADYIGTLIEAENACAKTVGDRINPPPAVPVPVKFVDPETETVALDSSRLKWRTTGSFDESRADGSSERRYVVCSTEYDLSANRARARIDSMTE